MKAANKTKGLRKFTKAEQEEAKKGKCWEAYIERGRLGVLIEKTRRTGSAENKKGGGTPKPRILRPRAAHSSPEMPAEAML